MTVKTHWTIDHACGHTTEIDLSGRPADRRAGYARWLAERDCTPCWQATRTTDDESTAEWLARKRAAEQTAAEEWAEQYRMPTLDGTERTVPWGTRCRHQLVTAAHTALVLEGTTGETEWTAVEDAARSLTLAAWWIDNRDAAPADLPALLAAATDDDRLNDTPRS
ncbi:hypothetical protein MUU72_24275 [Streptomyces sp. RS10V-4]|uniref:hypothetical protein n=1 Tax=Streptomyces rhizoryzae TaxID=2932493 RepID=UPI002003388E|nr:hypothetical protein [Streptomyces rhizoryzae]MCK7626184.1 hypothetical protein [Streptomyces rhizoryzae]